MTTLLVTGAAGFIGSHFTRHWITEHPEDSVVALDALTYAGTETNLADIRDRIVFTQADIVDGPRVEQLLHEHRVDVAVHFAAESHNSAAVLDPTLAFRTNVLGTQQLLEACRRVGVDRFHHVSTCEVYGDLALDSEEIFTEESPLRPRTPYSASKAGAEHAVRAYYETYGLPITISNGANNYGPYQLPEKVLPLFITRALSGQSLPLYRSRHYCREWIHVLDHCRAIETVLLQGKTGQTYHVGTGLEASIEQLADLVLNELGLPATLKSIVQDRPGHDRRYVLDTTKIRTELGWAPTVHFDPGVRETIRWYRDNRQWWEPLLDRSPVIEDVWEEKRGHH